MDKLLSVLLGILVLFISQSECVYPAGCYYSQNIVLNTQYYIYNLNYPANYTPYTDCIWVATAPAGSRINLVCTDVQIPTSPGCTGDQLKVSLTGDTAFGDAGGYCGTGTLSLKSQANKISIELLATYNSRGGRFQCTLTATQDPPSCECGLKKGTRIVGGSPTGINEYPMMAGLIDYRTGAEILCGGTIISDRYVLSAAHCLRLIPTAYMGVLVGDWNITSGTDTPGAALYKVEIATEHPLFNANAQTNDIALIKTATRITFSLYVGPACLPFKYVTADFSGATVTYLGWGQLFFNGPKPDVLYKVDASIISNSQCQQQYPSNQITPNQMCTYSSGKDACQGDSGGPALWMDPSTTRLQVLGVTSTGYACGIKPGIDTRVTSYLNWIMSLSPEVSYCVK